MTKIKTPKLGKSAIPAVRCAYTRLVRLDDIKPNPRNPNRHPPEQLRLFAKIVVHQGIRKPVVVGKESGLTVTGHGLVETLKLIRTDLPAAFVAKHRELSFCPVDEQSFAGSAPGKPGPDEIAHMLADNSLPQLADLDPKAVAQLEAELSITGLDLELTGRVAIDPDAPALNAEFPITAKMLEQHDFVVIVCDNATDFVFLQSLVGARTEKSYKKTGVGTGRVVPFNRFLQTIRENRHSLDVQGEHDDDATARA